MVSIILMLESVCYFIAGISGYNLSYLTSVRMFPLYILLIPTFYSTYIRPYRPSTPFLHSKYPLKNSHLRPFFLSLLCRIHLVLPMQSSVIVVWFNGLKCISGKFFLFQRVIPRKNRCTKPVCDDCGKHHKTRKGSDRTEPMKGKINIYNYE